MEAGLPLFSISFTVLLKKEHLLPCVGLDPVAAWAAEGHEEKQRSCTKKSEKRDTGSKMCSYSCDSRASRMSSLLPLCRSYQTMLDSFLVFSHLLVGVTTEKQITKSNGDCVKQEKILCSKTWTKQTAFSCFSKHAASLFHCSHSFSWVLPPHPASTPYKLPCKHHCLSRGGV